MKWIFILALFIGCTEPNPGYEEQDSSILPSEKEEKLITSDSLGGLWICYHPGTAFHEQECPSDDRLFPDGCLVEGDDSKFCWQLLREDCETLATGVEWQEKFCPLLSGE